MFPYSKERLVIEDTVINYKKKPDMDILMFPFKCRWPSVSGLVAKTIKWVIWRNRILIIYHKTTQDKACKSNSESANPIYLTTLITSPIDSNNNQDVSMKISGEQTGFNVTVMKISHCVFVPQVVRRNNPYCQKLKTGPFVNNSWAATWQNQQSECAPSEDSDQPGHPPSLISLRCPHEPVTLATH